MTHCVQRVVNFGQPALAPVCLVACLALLVLGAGCARKPVNAASDTNSLPPWSWSAFPPTTNMRLGLVTGRVMPRNNYSILSPLSGPIHFYVTQQQTNVPAGFTWAEFEPRILAAETAALDLAKTRLVQKERLLYEIEVPRQKLRMQKEIEDAQRQISLLELLREHPDMAPSAAHLAGIKESVVTLDTIKHAREELSLLLTNFTYVCETNPAVVSADLQAQRTDLDARELELERRQHQMRFNMPFSGQLNLSVPLVAGVSEYPVTVGQELAVLRDTTAILLRVALIEPGWTTLPTTQMRATVTLPNGTSLQAPFSYKRLEKSQFREEIVYYFEFPPALADAATRLIGAEFTCEIWVCLDQPAHIVPKLTLTLRDPSAFGTRRWDEGLARLFPGARLLLEGQTDLAISVP